MSVWNVSGTASQQQLVNEAIAACDFPFDLLLPGLQAQTGKTQIPVVWRDLSAYGYVRNETLHTHLHDNEDGTGHIVSPPGRQFVAGLAWSNGKIEIDPRCEQIDGGQLAREVFLAEAAHAVDFFYLTEPMRQAIWASLHGGTVTPHPGHDWFEPAAYGDQIGEAWMAGFVHAFSDYVPWQGAWSHKFTVEQARALRPFILPNTEIRLTGRSWITTYGNGRVELLWTDARGDTLTVRRNDVNWITTANDGKLVSNLATRRGTFRYQLVDRGGRKSNIAVVSV